MAHILTVTCGLPSVVYASVELARRLAVDGHRLTCVVPPDARTLVEHQGLDHLALDSSRYGQFLESDAGLGVLHRLLDLPRRRERATASVAVGGFARSVQDLDPDLVLINGEMHEHIIAVLGIGVPVALVNSFVSIWKVPGVPPPHHMVRPGVGWKGSRGVTSLLWHGLRLRKRGRACLQRFRRVGCDRVSILRELAREAGVDFRRETDDGQWLMPFTYRRLPVLSLHALEFEFPHRPPDHVHYVGPMVLDARIDRPLAPGAQAELDALIERRRRTPDERRLIHAAFGSAFSTDIGFLRRLVGIVAERPHWDLVISLSDRIAPSDLGPLPPGVHAFTWLPQMQVLEHADVMVTHGGINTIDECVLSGVPTLVYCGFETDMGGTTARVVHHGIGIAGDRRRDSTSVIRAHIDRLLHEARFGANVNRLRQHYIVYAERRVAERTVEALLAQQAREPVTVRRSGAGPRGADA